jgi:predicted aspartyl protease
MVRHRLAAALAGGMASMTLALILTSCGPIRSAQVADQINGMIGLSKEHVLSCMGPPSETAQVASTEVWSYSTRGPVTSTALISANQNFAVGSLTTHQEYCLVNLTMKNDLVVAANYRSQGKLLSPSLPCYSVLHACVPDPEAAKASTNATKEATAFCKGLYKDPRLDPLRGVLSLDEAPTLKMQTIQEKVTEEQRVALDTLQPIREQCRARIAAANPKLWKIMIQVDPSPTDEVKKLYDRSITIGQYNSDRQTLIARFQAALASADQQNEATLEPAKEANSLSDSQQATANRTAQSSVQVALHKQGGVLVVPVVINDSIKLDFVLDSGAADVSIPADVVSTLMRAGTISRNDFLGSTKYKLADGTVVPSQTFRIRSLKVADKVLTNVTGSISSAEGPLLLGQSFLARFKSWSIDNSRQVLVLE